MPTVESEELLFHGAQLRQLLADTGWVNRRVEEITFVDDRTTRRRISIDFQLPQSYAHPAEEQPSRWFVPLALVSKESQLVEFDLLDEEERALPLVTRTETQRLSAATLIRTAATILRKSGRALDPTLSAYLQEVPTCSADEARQAIGAVLEPHGALDDRRLLRRDPFMTSLVADLAKNFLVLTPLVEATERRIIKLSFLEEIEVPRFKLTRALGWRSAPFEFVIGGVGLAGSYHCEIEAPANLEILRARLSAQDRAGTTRDATRSGAKRARVHLRLDDLSSDLTGRLEAHLRAHRPGMPQTAALFALGVSTLLTGGAFIHWQAAESGNTAAALLLVVPVLLAAYLSKPEHELSNNLLRGIRWLTASVGIVAFLAAGSIVVTPDHLVIWLAAAGITWLLTGALAASALLPRR